MNEEIFGPILPLLPFKDIKEAIKFVNDRPKPLALYYFGTNKRIVLGKHTGANAIKSKLEEYGIDLDNNQFDKVFDQIDASFRVRVFPCVSYVLFKESIANSENMLCIILQ